MKPFIYTDGGRRECGYIMERDDCAVRAFALAFNKPYKEMHDLLRRWGRKNKDGFDIVAFLSWREVDGIKVEEQFFVGRKGLKKPYLLDFIRENPIGTYIAHHSCVKGKSHVFCIRNGRRLDTFFENPKLNRVYKVFDN